MAKKYNSLSSCDVSNDMYKNNLGKGSSVRLSNPFNGTEFEQINTRKLLDLNVDYIVEDIYIGSGEVWIWLKGFPNQYFNGLQFNLAHRVKHISKLSLLYFNYYWSRWWDKVGKMVCC